jgi:hypothetical protein
MPDRILRRSLLVAGASAMLARRARAAGHGDGTGSADAHASIPSIPLFVRIVSTPSGAVAAPAFVDASLTEAARIFGEHGLAFVERRARGAVDASHADVVSRADRDAFAALLLPGAINVFVVRTLEDVDEPGRRRMGVAWRCLRDLEKKYIVLAAYARPAVLAHELGHFLGNPHSKVRNNLMSYEHDEGARVVLAPAQARVARETARRLFAEERLSP